MTPGAKAPTTMTRVERRGRGERSTSKGGGECQPAKGDGDMHPPPATASIMWHIAEDLWPSSDNGQALSDTTKCKHRRELDATFKDGQQQQRQLTTHTRLGALQQQYRARV